jgi:hypothetical protein
VAIVYDHGRAAEAPELFGWGLHRYREGTTRPALVIDQTRGVAKPSNGGLSLSGSFDLLHDATLYVGLAAPFIVADFGAELVRAFPSTAPVLTDYLLQPGGGRTPAPAESFVPGENDLWSIGYV